MLTYSQLWGIRKKKKTTNPEVELLEYKAAMEFRITLGILSILGDLQISHCVVVGEFKIF